MIIIVIHVVIFLPIMGGGGGEGVLTCIRVQCLVLELFLFYYSNLKFYITY